MRRKLGWLIVALLAPEWVCYLCGHTNVFKRIGRQVLLTAYFQHAEATRLGHVMRTAFNQNQPPSTRGKLECATKELVVRLGSKLKFFELQEDTSPPEEQQRHSRTHTHSLYALMGGFVADVRDLEVNYLPEWRQIMTLSPAALEFIAEHNPGIIPDISESKIQDKSKASAVTKFLTCAQASWFGVQCLTRLAQGLSISLLEVNTAVHAACALLLYVFFWWKKPLDVDEPTPCVYPDFHPLGALMTLADTERPTYYDVLATKRMEGSSEASTSQIDHATSSYQQIGTARSPRTDGSEASEDSSGHFGYVPPPLCSEPSRFGQIQDPYEECHQSERRRPELASQAVANTG
jgi:hypothetical protein